MYIEIGLQTYTYIKSLTFSPEADVTATSLPVNSFTAEMLADADDIEYGAIARLYDDRDNLWASYLVINAENVGSGMARITAQSEIKVLDDRDMTAVMYSAEPIADVLALIFEDIHGSYQLDSSYSGATITGFCPDQTARERLLWVCFALGAYVKTFFTDRIEILPVSDTETLIPLDRTFWRPKVSLGEYVTAVRVTAYTFTQAASSDAWKTDNNSYRFPEPWTAAEQVFTLTNPDAPQDAPENVVEVDELYLVNTANASAILTRLSQYYFKRPTVALDCIDNGEFYPGQCAVASVGPDALVSGYIKSASFRFGLQARATLQLIASEDRDGAKLTVNYLYSGGRIGQAEYYLPVGYAYSIQNPHIDRTVEERRFIYRPINENATGTIVDGTNVKNENYAIALEGHGKILRIVSVDEVELQTSSGAYVGVIA